MAASFPLSCEVLQAMASEGRAKSAEDAVERFRLIDAVRVETAEVVNVKPRPQPRPAPVAGGAGASN